MGEIVKWCITAVSAMLPAITIYLVDNVLSWKSGKKSAPKNEIAQPRQYFWCCAVGTMLLFMVVLLVLFLPEGMVQPEEGRISGALIMLGITFIAFLCTLWFYRWRIVLGKKEFTCYFFLRTRTYQYSEVHFRDYNSHYRIYCGKKYVCSVLDETDNCERLRGLIAKYSPIHNPVRSNH